MTLLMNENSEYPTEDKCEDCNHGCYLQQFHRSDQFSNSLFSLGMFMHSKTTFVKQLSSTSIKQASAAATRVPIVSLNGRICALLLSVQQFYFKLAAITRLLLTTR